MIEINDTFDDCFRVYRVIDVNYDEGYCVTLLQSDIDGPVDQEEDNIGEFVLLSDFYEPELKLFN